MTSIESTHSDDPDLPDPFRPKICTQADLERVWRHLMEPLGFSRHSVWLMLIDSDDRPIRQLTEIEDSVTPPDDEMLAGLSHVLGHIAAEDPGSRWAFLRSRPGSARITDTDRDWARFLHRACHDAGVGSDVVHLATDEAVLPLPMDELGVRRLAAAG